MPIKIEKSKAISALFLSMIAVLLFALAHCASSGKTSPGLSPDLKLAPPSLRTDANKNQKVALGDLNGDGGLDFVVNFGQVKHIYVNDGTGNFISAQIITDTNNSQEIALRDLDGDGDLDLEMSSGQVKHIYINNGTGNFTSMETAASSVAE